MTGATATGATTYTFAYAYDAVGNRTAQTQTPSAAPTASTLVTNYSYDVANRLTSVNGVAYTWDANGNLTNDGSKVYTYTQANRLITVTASGLNWNATYNGDGARLKQTVNGSVTTYTQDLASPLPVVLQAKVGTTTTLYLFDMGTRPLAEYDSAWEYLLPDALSGVRQIADGNGNVTLSESYDPYGGVLNSQGNTTSAFGFTGEQTDSYTQLVFLRARYYTPQTGRFLTEDSWARDFQHSTGPNEYSYSNNNPIRYVDPSGFVSEDPWNPSLCDSWHYPAKANCLLIITNVNVPEKIRFAQLQILYEEVIVGMRIAPIVSFGRYSFKHAPEFWSHYFHRTSALGQGDPVTLEGHEWGEWVSTHPYHKAMHDKQVDDFFRVKVWPAAQRCQTTIGPWRAGRGDPPGSASPEGGYYPFVEAGYASNDVTVAIGRHFIEGDFYADNIRYYGPSVYAQVTINRFIDDRFDFDKDDGSIPIPDMLPRVTNIYPGIGHISHLWADAMAKANPPWAWRYDIHIKWTETFPYEWKVSQ